MSNKDLNIFDFFSLIFKNKKNILLSIIGFVIIGLIGYSSQKEKFKATLVINPLSLIEFNNFYISNTKIDNSNKSTQDSLSRLDISPYTLFYSYLNELQNIKTKNNLNKIEIQWSPYGGEYAIHLSTLNYTDEKDMLNEINQLTTETNKNLLYKLRENISEEIKIIDTMIKNQLYEVDSLIFRKNIIKQNLEKLDNMSLVNIKSIRSISNKIDINLVIIISILVGLSAGIIQILFSKYFKDQKNK